MIHKIGEIVNNINIDFEKCKQNLRDMMSVAEKDYQENKEYYQRMDFYNEIRINTSADSYVDFVNLDDIDKSYKMYDANLQEIKQEDNIVQNDVERTDIQSKSQKLGLPDVKYNGVIVSLGDKNNINVNEYYLIRYQNSEDSRYTVYFVGYLRNNGFEDYTPYMITEGEVFGNDSMMENFIEE